MPCRSLRAVLRGSLQAEAGLTIALRTGYNTRASVPDYPTESRRKLLDPVDPLIHRVGLLKWQEKPDRVIILAGHYF